MLKVDKEKKQAKEEWSSKVESLKKKKVMPKVLPVFAKQRAYEREMKMIAVDESRLISREVHEQIQFAHNWGERRAEGEGEGQTQKENEQDQEAKAKDGEAIHDCRLINLEQVVHTLNCLA